MIVAGVSVVYNPRPSGEYATVRYVVLEQPSTLIEVGRAKANDIHQVDNFFKNLSQKHSNLPIVVEIQRLLLPLLNRVWMDNNNIHFSHVTKKKREECFHAVMREFHEYSKMLDSDHIIALGLALLYQPPLWTTFDFSLNPGA
jgi:hypothetical protein